MHLRLVQQLSFSFFWLLFIVQPFALGTEPSPAPLCPNPLQVLANPKVPDQSGERPEVAGPRQPDGLEGLDPIMRQMVENYLAVVRGLAPGMLNASPVVKAKHFLSTDGNEDVQAARDTLVASGEIESFDQGGLGYTFLWDDGKGGRYRFKGPIIHGDGKKSRENFARETKHTIAAGKAKIGAAAEFDTSTGLIKMENIEGGNLRSLLATIADLPPDVKERYLETFTASFAHQLRTLHELGIAHLDLKPENLMMPEGQNGRTRIIDYGLALDAAELKEKRALGDYQAGTPGYMGPGAKEGKPGFPDDVYAYSIIVSEVAKTSPVFLRKRPRLRLVLELMKQHLPGEAFETKTDLELVGRSMVNDKDPSFWSDFKNRLNERSPSQKLAVVLADLKNDPSLLRQNLSAKELRKIIDEGMEQKGLRFYGEPGGLFYVNNRSLQDAVGRQKNDEMNQLLELRAALGWVPKKAFGPIPVARRRPTSSRIEGQQAKMGVRDPHEGNVRVIVMEPGNVDQVFAGFAHPQGKTNGGNQQPKRAPTDVIRELWEAAADGQSQKPDSSVMRKIWEAAAGNGAGKQDGGDADGDGDGDQNRALDRRLQIDPIFVFPGNPIPPEGQ